MGEICSIRSTFAPGFSKFAALRGFSGDAGKTEGMVLTCGMRAIEAPTREMPGYQFTTSTQSGSHLHQSHTKGL